MWSRFAPSVEVPASESARADGRGVTHDGTALDLSNGLGLHGQECSAALAREAPVPVGSSDGLLALGLSHAAAVR